MNRKTDIVNFNLSQYYIDQIQYLNRGVELTTHHYLAPRLKKE
jgi:hypothetical protein